MTVAEVIVEFIVSKGIDTVFFLSGTGSIFLDDAIAKNKNVRPIAFKNEATGPMMAMGYAKASGKPGVVFVTTGPGGANAISGVVEAWVDSVPIIVFSGQVKLQHSSRYRGVNTRTMGIQEIDIVSLAKPVTKYSVMLSDPNDIHKELEEAYWLATNGRRGPVWIDIPFDVQSALVGVV